MSKASCKPTNENLAERRSARMKIIAFASEAMRFTERVDDYEAKNVGLQEKLPALNARIDEISRQLNQIELKLLEP